MKFGGGVGGAGLCVRASVAFELRCLSEQRMLGAWVWFDFCLSLLPGGVGDRNCLRFAFTLHQPARVVLFILSGSFSAQIHALLTPHQMLTPSPSPSSFCCLLALVLLFFFALPPLPRCVVAASHHQEPSTPRSPDKSGL